MNCYEAYIIHNDGREVPWFQSLYKSEAKDQADRAKNIYPTARVVVLDFHSHVVYEAA